MGYVSSGHGKQSYVGKRSRNLNKREVKVFCFDQERISIHYVNDKIYEQLLVVPTNANSTDNDLYPCAQKNHSSMIER